MKAHSDLCFLRLGSPGLGCFGSFGWLGLPGSWGAVLLGWPALRAAMDTDRATTSPWNKIHEVARSKPENVLVFCLVLQPVA